MIISEQKPLEEILALVREYSRIFLVGCGDCATICNSGSDVQLREMRDKLHEQGKTVTGMCVPDSTCIAAKLKTATAAHLALLRGSDAILVFSCGLGVQSVRDNDRFGLAVLPGCDTTAGALLDNKGNLLEKCAMCGQCVLGQTFGICPVALCPKGLLNGPCGGMKNGNCELNNNQECAWAVIYKEAQKRNRLDTLKKVQPPRNYKKAVRPHKLVLNKADIQKK